jgi:hypothetical protein
MTWSRHRADINARGKLMGFASAQPILRAAIQPGFRHGSLIKLCLEP